MAAGEHYGYAGKILRVDLSRGEITEEVLDEEKAKRDIGGTILGARILYEEVPPEVDWSHPENRLILATGPLGGTRMGGSGTFSVITKGALTNGGTTTQANGFFGAYLRFSGFDGIVVTGKAQDWVYLHIHDGTAEIKDAQHLVGRNTWEMDDRIKEELGRKEREMSVFGVGPAGENLVRFAAICGDKGHVAGHNGVGAVMGSKKLKAIAVDRGRPAFKIKDNDGLAQVAKEMLEVVQNNVQGLDVYRWGTLKGVTNAAPGGWLPIKNYTTNIYPIEPQDLEKFSPEYIRGHFEPKPNPCWACQMHHCHMMRIPEGPYAGEVIEEPEYEGFAALGPAIGNTDVASTMFLANEVDRLGLEINEAGWLLGFTIECYERGLLNIEDTDGLEMTWGNAPAVLALLRRIAHREGLGDLLAEGVMRAAQRLGEKAPELAIHTKKGNTPRGHDHRTLWSEMLDTCTSSSGTIETNRLMSLEALGIPRVTDPFSPEQLAFTVAKTKGAMQFEDSLGTCRFNTQTNVVFLTRALNAATGWDFTPEEAMKRGRKAVNLLRAFNIRHGISPELDAPSPRYGSTPVDGPVQGKGIAPLWEGMVRDYYEHMGWDRETGKPLPETLRSLDLGHVVPHLW